MFEFHLSRSHAQYNFTYIVILGKKMFSSFPNKQNIKETKQPQRKNTTDPIWQQGKTELKD